MATQLHAAGTSNSILEPMTEMNMTPLIDVLLVLIIMLIITIPRQNHWLPMALASGAASGDKPDVVALDLDFDGTVSWNGVAIPDRSALDGKFGAIAGGQRRTEVHLKANRLVPYKSVASVLALAQRRGVTNIGLIGNERFM